MNERIGVLLMAYGTPRNLDEVEPYYMDIRGGRRASPELIEALKARYAAVGGKTPLLEITQRQAHALEQILNANGERFKTYVGMKHWHPFIDATVKQIARDGIRKVIALVLAPHYSRLSIEQYIERVEKTKAELKVPLEITYVQSWGTQPLFIESIAERMEEARLRFSKPEWDAVEVIFSAHSLPMRILEWDDPYPRELRATAELVTQRLGLKRDAWRFAFQSAGRTNEAWLGPDLLDELERTKGEGYAQVLVAPIGFVADHLEILYDVDIEAAAKARALGLELQRIASPNAMPRFVESLAAVVNATALGN
jgi:ferrochelatase